MQKAQVCRLGLCYRASSNGEQHATGEGAEHPGEAAPYLVPVNFVFTGGCFYIHSAPEGRKIRLIRENNNACIEVDIPLGLETAEKPCAMSYYYQSVIATGTCTFVEEPNEKQEALAGLTTKYGGQTYEFSAEELNTVTIIKMTPATLTGKQNLADD